MGFTKKTWKNRIAEYINRRRLTMEDGSTNLVTVARDEGTISQEGDAFNAANMNDLEDRIEAGFDEVKQSLTNINTYVGEDGKLHFVDSTGADSVLPFNVRNRRYYYKSGDSGMRDNALPKENYVNGNNKLIFNSDSVYIYRYGNTSLGFSNIDVTDINYLVFDIKSNTYTTGINVNGTNSYWGGRIIDVSELTGNITVKFNGNNGATEIYNMYGCKSLKDL